MRTVEQRVDAMKRAAAGVFLVPPGAMALFSAWMAATSRFGPEHVDSQGHLLVFATVLGLVCAITAAAMIPWFFPRERRAPARRWSLIGLLLVAAGFLLMLLTA